MGPAGMHQIPGSGVHGAAPKFTQLYLVGTPGNPPLFHIFPPCCIHTVSLLHKGTLGSAMAPARLFASEMEINNTNTNTNTNINTDTNTY